MTVTLVTVNGTLSPRLERVRAALIAAGVEVVTTRAADMPGGLTLTRIYLDDQKFSTRGGVVGRPGARNRL